MDQLPDLCVDLIFLYLNHLPSIVQLAIIFPSLKPVAIPRIQKIKEQHQTNLNLKFTPEFFNNDDESCDPDNYEYLNHLQETWYFPHINLLSEDWLEYLAYPNAIVAQSKTVILLINERYISTPVPVTLVLYPDSGLQTSFICLKYISALKKVNSILNRIHPRPDFNPNMYYNIYYSDLSPEFDRFYENALKSYTKSFPRSLLVDEKIIQDCQEHQGLTIKSLLRALRICKQTIYPNSEGAACSLDINERNEISYYEE